MLKENREQGKWDESIWPLGLIEQMGMIQLWEQNYGRESVKKWSYSEFSAPPNFYPISFRFGAQIAGHKTQVKDGKQQLGK